MDYMIGIDLGTSSTKTVLFDRNGHAIRSATRFYPMSQPRNGWAEQDPEDWWKAAKETVREVLRDAGISPADVRGVGLSGQMHGLVALDAQDRVPRFSGATSAPPPNASSSPARWGPPASSRSPRIRP